jgi:hypothetical protein
MDQRLALRQTVLVSFGATAGEAEELLAYNENRFDVASAAMAPFPLQDEPFVSIWEQYAQAVRDSGTISILFPYLVQLYFPIQAGISQTDAYKAATRIGANPQRMALASGLQLRSPQRCEVLIHSTAAGRIPLIIAAEREDFVALVQALTRKNEPAVVPDSMGACMIAGYPNWHRIHLLRQAYEDSGGHFWPEEFRAITSRKELYQDQFLILSSGPYSNVPAEEVSQEAQNWLHLSLTIRRDHVCAH